jgi:hypothetical protein
MLVEMENMMSTTHVQTLETRVTTGDDIQARSRQLVARNEDLNSYITGGYTLAHTTVIDSTEYVTFVDTLTHN